MVSHSECLAWSIVETVLDPAQLGCGDGREIEILGQVLTKEPLVFSFEPRCQGLCGSQKKIGMPVSMVKLA